MSTAPRRSLLSRRLPPSLMSPGFSRGNERYAVYDAMREISPVYWDVQAGCWVVTGHAEAMTVLRHPAFKADRMETVYALVDDAGRQRLKPLVEAISHFLLFLDDPDHARIRALIHRAFTPRHVDALRSHMEDLVHQLLDEAHTRGGMEMMGEFAYRLPTTLVAEMLGVPPRDHDQFRAWTEGLAGFLGELIPTAAAMETGVAAMAEMSAYFVDALAHVRAHPGEDLLTALAQAEEQGHSLSSQEIISTAILLLAAGHETTASLIGSGTWLLLHHPQVAQQLREEPWRLASAIEEMLRMESPIQLTGRQAAVDVEVAGQKVHAGDFVAVSLGAANRDPRVFPDPHTFQVDRADNRHLAFSHGGHYCVGAMLARAEAQVAFHALLQRCPDLALAGDDTVARWKQTQVFRGLTQLHLKMA